MSPIPVAYVVGEAPPAEGLREAMGAYGFSFVPVDGPEALVPLLEEEAFEAVVVDLDAPGETPEQRLAALVGLRPVFMPLLALSHSDGMALQLDAVRAGCAAFLRKPVQAQALCDRLDALLVKTEPDPYRILVVDDSRTQAAFLGRMLEKVGGMVTRTVTDPALALEVLDAFRPDLVLMDLYMPFCTGVELAAIIRLNPAYLGIPIVFLSTETDEAKQLAAMSRGADAFLTKNLRPEFLVSSIRIRAERTRLLRSLMLKDGLTGLYNHTSLLDRLEMEMARARRCGSPLSFAMLDVDHFKRVNDRYGHVAGDRVLQSLAKLLLRRLRASDTVGRYGGEEFGVVLADAKLAVARRLVDELREAFGEIPHAGADGPFLVSFSAGVVAIDGTSTALQVATAADAALYRAKRAGRNRVEAG